MDEPIDLGDLVDDLVADIIDHAGEHMRVAQKAIEKLTGDERLLERYGDFALGITFGSVTLRRDVHRALKAKGLSVRAIAAKTGASKSTVERDTAVPDGTPVEREVVPDGTPESTPAATPVEAPEAEQEAEVIVPSTPPYKGKSVATATKMADPRPEVVACIKAIEATGTLTLTERRMLQDILLRAA